jgi:hypothetical protein
LELIATAGTKSGFNIHKTSQLAISAIIIVPLFLKIASLFQFHVWVTLPKRLHNIGLTLTALVGA